MLSNTEIRRIIESGFAPFSCRCELTSNGAITVEIHDAASGRVELFVTGIALADLTTSREIARVIAELRAELALARLEEPAERRLSS